MRFIMLGKTVQSNEEPSKMKQALKHEMRAYGNTDDTSDIASYERKDNLRWRVRF